MDEKDRNWTQELRRRVAVYDALEGSGGGPGQMGAGDYLGLLVLTVALVAGFWIWGV